MVEKFLIKNTTRKEREKIVEDALGMSDIGCESCSGALGYDMYLPYIEGKMEIDEVTRKFNRGYVSGVEQEEKGSCGFQK